MDQTRWRILFRKTMLLAMWDASRRMEQLTKDKSETKGTGE